MSTLLSKRVDVMGVMELASDVLQVSPVKATPVAFVETIIQAYAHYQKSPDAALEYAQITPKDLMDPDGCITALQMEQFSLRAMRELDDEALGWLSRPMRWGSYGFLARGAISSPRLRVALLRWCRHHGLLTDDIALRLEVRGAEVQVVVQEHFIADEAQRQLGLLTLLRNIHGFSCWLLDSQIPLLEVALPFSEPRYKTQVAQMFSAPICYRAEVASLRFDASYLEMPVRRDETALNHMLQRALLVVVKPYRRDRLVQQRVRQLLAQEDGGASHTAETLALALHVSVRSLHRFLQEDGTSLQKIKDEVRCDKAMQLLRRTKQPVKKIAGLVGFDNAKSFTRAFTRWTGQSPVQFRQAQ